MTARRPVLALALALLLALVAGALMSAPAKAGTATAAAGAPADLGDGSAGAGAPGCHDGVPCHPDAAAAALPPTVAHRANAGPAVRPMAAALRAPPAPPGPPARAPPPA